MKEFLGLGRENPMNDGESFCMTTSCPEHAEHRQRCQQAARKVSAQCGQMSGPEYRFQKFPSYQSPMVFMHHHGSAGYGRPSRPLPRPQLAAMTKISTHFGAVSITFPTKNYGVRTNAGVNVLSLCQKPAADAARSTRRNQHLKWPQADEILNPEALTIGFPGGLPRINVQRFFCANPERLEKILMNKDRPVQILFFGAKHTRMIIRARN